MISEEEARRKILDAVHSLPERTRTLSRALDRFSARDVVARLAFPNFDNSAMDGYAVVAASSQRGARLPVIGEQPAGLDRQLRISPGQAVRIFTGAPVPAGADAVVMQEDVVTEGTEILLNVDVDPGEFIRKRGCDLSEGQKILSKGERIHPVKLALLAAQGFSEIVVGGEVLAAILSTGDELVKAGEKIQQGQIYESNSVLLQGLLQRCGANVKSAEYCRDERESLIEAIKRGIQSHILIITGGVSVGKHDLVQSTLRSLRAEIDIWRVAIKPGKPFLFGSFPAKSRYSAGETPAGPTAKMPVPRDCFIFGLPGNPVSAFVTFLQFVRPAILKMMGATNLDLTHVPARLIVDLTNDGDRPHYVRGILDDGTFTPIGRQESHALFGLSQSNALLRVAVGESLKAGEIVAVQLWN